MVKKASSQASTAPLPARKKPGTSSTSMPPVDGGNVARVVAPIAVLALAVCGGVFLLAAPSTTNTGSSASTGTGSGGDAASQALVQWGTFRPNVYFGTRARTPKSPLIGMMWYDVDDPQFFEHIRHDAEERDGLKSYGWLRHDGRTYGMQSIVDAGGAQRSGGSFMNLTTEWIAQPGDAVTTEPPMGWDLASRRRGTGVPDPAFPGGWVARVSGAAVGHDLKSSSPVRRNISVIWYVATQDADHRLTLRDGDSATDNGLPSVHPIRIDAECSGPGGVGNFELQFRTARAPGGTKAQSLHPSATNKPDGSREVLSHTRYWGTTLPADETWRVKDPLRTALGLAFNQAVEPWQRAMEEKRRKGQAPTQPERLVALLPNEVNSGSPPAPPRHPQAPPPPPPAARRGTPQNVVFLQQFFTLPFSVDVVMTPAASEQALNDADRAADSESSEPPVFVTQRAVWHHERRALTDAAAVTGWLDTARAAFEQRFDATFPVVRATTDAGVGAERQFAMAALSNMIGGIGYFHGSSLIARHPPSRNSRNKNDGVVNGPVSTLYTAVPSRSFFPRGFLWDEGFHQLLVGRWDPTISADVMKHWFNLMDDNGWIPREQILGLEARARVPAEFQVQQPHIANPPTLFLALLALLNRVAQQRASASASTASAAGTAAALESIYELLDTLQPRLKKHVDWYFKTQTTFHSELKWPNVTTTTTATAGAEQQPPSVISAADMEQATRLLAEESSAGKLPSAFRWGGRTVDHNLASGLDDFPRASYLVPQPSAGSAMAGARVPVEGHVDLHAWMIVLCRTMAQLSDALVGYTQRRIDAHLAAPPLPRDAPDAAVEADATALLALRKRTTELETSRDRYRALSTHLLAQLLNYHYDDGGADTAGAAAGGADAATHLFFDFIRNTTRGVSAKSGPPPREFQRHVGYVSLFPLLLRVLPVDSPHLTHTLQSLRNDSALSRSGGGGKKKGSAGGNDDGGVWSPFGIRSLSARDALFGTREDYWRGAIWLNCNFLAVSALHHYAFAVDAAPVSDIGRANRARAAELYAELRANLIRNLVSEYQRTGYLWEQYHPRDGRGRRSHPFTGWSALIVLIMGENYDWTLGGV